MDFPVFPFLITRGGVVIRMLEGGSTSQVRIGGFSAGPRLQVCTFFLQVAQCMHRVR